MRESAFKLFVGGLVMGGALVPFANCAQAEGDSAAKLLDDSYTLSSKLPVENRSLLLVRLVDFSTEVNPQRTEAWSEELSKLAHKMKLSWNRISTEKNALVPLARVNPVLAFERLSQVEKPVAADRVFPEDVRADAAASIFPSYLKAVGHPAVANIRKESQRIGESGEYPYRAIGLVIEELLSLQSDAATRDDLFTQALAFYRRPSVFLDGNSEFFELLQHSRFAVEESLYRKGLREFVTHLRSSATKEPSSFSAEVHTVDGVFPFSSQKQMLLFRIFPVVARMDRELGIELATEYPWLQHADSEIKGIAASGTVDEPSQSNVQEINKETREGLLVRRIQHLSSTDPVSALKDAQLIESEPERSGALATIIPALTRVDQALARDTYLQLTRKLESLPEGKTKLGGLVASAQAACNSGYDSACADYTNQSLDYGVQLFNASEAEHTDWVTMKHPGSKDLINVAQFGAENVKQPVIERIRKVNNLGLRAFLLAYAAMGIHESASTITTTQLR